MYLVVAYDISDDRRRTKLHDVLLNYGVPVQYSLFECQLDSPQVERLKRAVARVTRAKTDRIRYYYLCQECLAKIEGSGPAVEEQFPAEYVV